jgi:hypothetical protein
MNLARSLARSVVDTLQHGFRSEVDARRQKANDAVRGDYVHTVPNPAGNRGYRPGRKTSQRRRR